MKRKSDTITDQIRELLEEIKALRCMSDPLGLKDPGPPITSAINDSQPVSLVGPAYDFLEKKVFQKKENQNQNQKET